MTPALVPAIWGTGAAAMALGWCAYGMVAPNSSLFGRVIGRGPREGRTLYLTFDDGPNPGATDRILDVLEDRGVPAAFFVLGRHVRLHPQIASRLARSPHLIGNHTQDHAKLHLRGRRFIEGELRAAHSSITDVLGRTPRCFRAPHGLRNPAVHSVARELGYDVFGWTLGVWDSDCPGAEEIRRRVRHGLRPGVIILLHDGDGYAPAGNRAQTAEALDGIIRDARDEGYEFRPLAELLRGPDDARARDTERRGA
jgi:peptidoglycan/xylan/chitin deacetylase (PgdA/CDA1 family)